MVSCAAIIILTIGILVAGAGAFLRYWLFPLLVEQQVTKSVKLIAGTDAYERWEELPIPIIFKVYFFNVSNPEEVHEGGTPNVTEIGPYIYNQYRSKVNITQDNSDVLSYYQNAIYEFDENASYPLTEHDSITIVNLPLMSVITVAEHTAGSSYSQLTALNSAVNTIFSNPSNVFIETTPRDFLFDGIYLMCNTSFLSIITRTVCNRIEENAPVTMPRLSDGRFRFSLFDHKNNSNDGRYSINSGVDNVSLLGEILSWENSTMVDTWRENSTCNNIYGSDSTIFPPFRTPESDVNIFNTDICRTVRLEYMEDSTLSGIIGHRYVSEERMLASPTKNPDNECFCLNKTKGIRGDDGCLLDGTIELWDCQGAPIVLSLPHFLLADGQYQSGVNGLNPNVSLHRIFIDLEPYTGMPLRGSKRVQFNIFLRTVNRIALTANLNTVLMPIFWIDEGMELNDELIEELQTSLFDVLRTLTIIQCGFIIGGSALAALGISWLLVSCCLL
ncbi:sensory neuron membrane protein 2 [Cephus cinctus]|uniref:Sensory neuron membrane protein 2 n=1 Tax=Cephus cinctus TaxID=211228 RepID=A0AAJ7RBH4_CEPCN|nr:sensory neuron membrane protein 2 [Cephus cinctus]